MKPKQLWAELQRYGYVFSLKKSLGAYFLVMILTMFAGMFFRLDGIYLVALCVGVCLIFPLFIRNAYKNRYSQRRFLEANTYIEQFLYSFQKSGKILTTLEDIDKLFLSGEMHRVLRQSIDKIKHTYEKNNVTEAALKNIEDAYPVSLITSMHRFSLQVEKNGGEYAQAILLMLDARRLWADRIYEHLKEKRRKRVQITISVFASLLLCVSLVYVAGKMHMDITSFAITKATTLAVLLADLWIIYRADAKLSIDCMEKETKKGDLMSQYQKVCRSLESGKKEAGFYTAKRQVMREFQKVFPRWLMDVSLLLQSENVQVALMKSYEDAPELIKPELEKMLEELRLHPTEIEPYLSFLQDFSLPEIQSAMKMLYSVSEGTGGNASSQIADIIRRNQVLQDKAEKLKNEDAVGGLYALFLAPQMTGAVKLLADMLVLFYVMAQAGAIHL